MSDDVVRTAAQAEAERQGLKRVFIRVMIVQVIALAVLWWLQSQFGTG